MEKSTKKRNSKISKGSDVYEQLEVLMKILAENKTKKQGKAFNKRIYLFNELDLLLSEGVDVKLLAQAAEYRVKGFVRTSRFKDFDAGVAISLEEVHEFLQELQMYLHESEVVTKYEYFINDDIVIPTAQQEQEVKNYLIKNGVVVNDFTYSLAMRRLIIGGDIESKYGKKYFMDRVNAKKNENPLNV